MTNDEDRIALFLDYENLAIGARDLTGGALDFRPIADALAERGRVVVRRAYADWSYFEEDRRMLDWLSHRLYLKPAQVLRQGLKKLHDAEKATDEERK